MNPAENSLTCPITSEPFKQPYMLLEDGFTYEKTAIQRWLSSHPNNSPFLGDLPSAHIVPNCSILKGRICPLTKEEYKEPYLCLEDGHTYEKSAMEKWIHASWHEPLMAGNSPPTGIRSPCNGTTLEAVPLYPNKALYPEGGIPANQSPLSLRYDLHQAVATMAVPKFPEPIFDTDIRQTIGEFEAIKLLASGAHAFPLAIVSRVGVDSILLFKNQTHVSEK